MPITEPEFLIRVFLVFVRIGGLMIAAPVFGHPSIPARVRVFLAVVLAYTMVGLVPPGLPPGAFTTVGLMLAAVSEALTGLLLGFVAQFVFFTVQFASELLGFQMGLSLAQAYDPVQGENMNHMGRLLMMTLTITFLLVDGHHLLLRALAGSFEAIPLAAAMLAGPTPILVERTGEVFVTSVRMATPFMITIYILDVALGVFARVVPQADLFSLAMPLKLLTGLILSYFFLSTFFPFVIVMTEEMLGDLLDAIAEMIPV